MGKPLDLSSIGKAKAFSEVPQMTEAQEAAIKKALDEQEAERLKQAELEQKRLEATNAAAIKKLEDKKKQDDERAAAAAEEKKKREEAAMTEANQTAPAANAGDGKAVNSGDGAHKAEESQLNLVADKKVMTYEEVMTAIDTMIGMDDFKNWIRSLDKSRNWNRVAEKLKIVASKDEQDPKKKKNPNFLHMVLVGNPGTGKSMAAELYCHYLKVSGRMPDADFYKVTAGDLVSPFIGETARAIKNLLKKGKDVGKKMIIHLDEAYILTNNEHGKEALAELVACMTEEAERVVFVLSGYDEPMGKMLSDNPGMRSRVRKTVPCKDYNNADLLLILKGKLRGEETEWKLSVESEQEIHTAFDAVRKAMGKHFGNGRVAELLLMNAGQELRARMAIEVEALTEEQIDAMTDADRQKLTERMVTITPLDVKNAVALMLAQAHDKEQQPGLEGDDREALIMQMHEEIQVLRQRELVTAGVLQQMFGAAALAPANDLQQGPAPEAKTDKKSKKSPAPAR